MDSLNEVRVARQRVERGPVIGSEESSNLVLVCLEIRELLPGSCSLAIPPDPRAGV